MRIAALYQFKPLSDPEQVKEVLEIKTKEHGILGMLMVATEGINGTIAGEETNLQTFLDFLVKDLGFDKLELKFAHYEPKSFEEDRVNADSPFYRMRISIKKEIVTLGVPDVDMTLLEKNPDNKIQFVPATEWNNLLGKKNVIVVDTRNDYEYDVGSFDTAINPNTKTFREFPQFINQLVEKQENQTEGEEVEEKPDLAIFCTGGIRCEKASVYLSQLPHFNRIYQLHGGILKYLEEIPEEESKWKGECFVFDQRVTVKHGLQPGSYELCRGCRHPLSANEMTEDHHYLEGIHCKYCYSGLTEKQIEGLKERQRQMLLAKERQTKHLGGQYTVPKRRDRRRGKGKGKDTINNSDIEVKDYNARRDQLIREKEEKVRDIDIDLSIFLE